jgi:hypothetical protein
MWMEIKKYTKKVIEQAKKWKKKTEKIEKKVAEKRNRKSIRKGSTWTKEYHSIGS